MFFSLILTIAILGPNASRSRLDGVYVGPLLSSVNVVVITTQGLALNASIFSNESESLHASGSFLKNDLTLSVKMADGASLSFTGKMRFDPEELVLFDSISKTTHKLYKVSSSTKYDVSRLFSETNDLALFGRWVSVYAVDNRGRMLDGKSYWEFDEGGNCRTRILVLPSSVLNRPIPPGFDPYRIVDKKWITRNGILTMSSQLGAESISYTVSYTINGDTLVTHSLHGSGISKLLRK